MKITITRTRTTEDGIFGSLSIDTSLFRCFTVENKVLSIPVGIYPMEFSYSYHFNRIMPHIIVPGRTDIMFHWANYPLQLKGCISVGNQEEPDAVDNSIVTFNKLNGIIGPYKNNLSLEIVEGETA